MPSREKEGRRSARGRTAWVRGGVGSEKAPAGRGRSASGSHSSAVEVHGIDADSSEGETNTLFPERAAEGGGAATLLTRPSQEGDGISSEAQSDVGDAIDGEAKGAALSCHCCRLGVC